MKNDIIKRLFIICLALAVVLPGTTVNAKIVLSKSEITKYINTIAHRQMIKVKNPSHSSAGGEWTVMGLARAGKITKEYKNIYKRNLKKTLDSCHGELSTRTYTEYSRTVIALTSIGENPYNFYGYDVISPLAEMDNVVKQGLNGAAYALIALNSGEYDVSPRSGYEGTVGSREKYKNLLMESEIPGGGWSMFGKKADVDMTAISIQALAPFFKSNHKVKLAINRGIDWLSKAQKLSGAFVSMGNENCESTSQVLTAISALGLNVKDKRFIKHNNTIFDGLMKYYDNGGFKHTDNTLVNQMSTDQAFYALVAYRNTLSNEPPLFNMKKVAVNKKARKPAAKKNKTKTKKSTVVKDEQIKKEKETKNKEKKKVENKNEPKTSVVEEETTVQNEKQKEDQASPVWFWIGLAVVFAGGVGFTVYKKVGRKDV